MPAQSQPNSPEDFSGFTPEAPDEHVIDRELDPLAQQGLHPEPVDTQPPVPFENPVPVEGQPVAQVENPVPVEPLPQSQVETPVSESLQRFPSETPVSESIERLPSQTPAPPEPDPVVNVEQPPLTEWETGRYSAEAPAPIEWVERQSTAEPPPAPDVVEAIPFTEPQKLQALYRLGPKLHQPYWMS